MTRSQRFRRRPGVVFREVDGEALILMSARGVVIGVNPTAAELLRNIEPEASTDGLVEALVKKFDVEEAQARADVERFLHDLESKGVIEGIPAET